MNFTIRNRERLQHMGLRRRSTHPIETMLRPNVADDQAVVPYRRIIARIRTERQQPPPRARERDLECGENIPEHIPPMPKAIRMLMCQGVPIGSRPMTSATGRHYFKYNGLKKESIRQIAEYLLSILEADRKDIIEAMMLNCRGWMMGRIIEEYSNAATTTQRKNLARILAGRALVCDTLGVIH